MYILNYKQCYSQKCILYKPLFKIILSFMETSLKMIYLGHYIKSLFPLHKLERLISSYFFCIHVETYLYFCIYL